MNERDLSSPTSKPAGSHLFDRPRNVRLVLRILYASCILVLFAQLWFGQGGGVAHSGPSHWFGFYAGFGFVACVALVLLAKQLRRLVMRDERYYDDE